MSFLLYNYCMVLRVNELRIVNCCTVLSVNESAMGCNCIVLVVNERRRGNYCNVLRVNELKYGWGGMLLVVMIFGILLYCHGIYFQSKA